MTRGARIVTWSASAVAAVVVCLIIAATVVTDRRWFSALGFAGVYDRELGAKATLFFGFGTAMGVLVAANIALAFALRPMLVGGPELTGITRYRAFFAPIHQRSLVLIALAVGLIAGWVASGHWLSLLMWRNGGSFGIKDPYFHLDAGFYVFDLPWWHFVTEFAMTGLILSFLAATLVHYLYGGLRLQPVDRHLTHSAGAHLAGIGAAILVLRGVQTWLNRHDLVTSAGDNFSGMSYVDYHAVLPGQALLAWVAVVCAVILVIAAWRTQWLYSTVAIGLYALAILGVGVIWPAVMRSAKVDGQVATAEKSFVVQNIAATRAAYGLDGLQVSKARVITPSPKQLKGNTQIDAVRTDSQLTSTDLGVLSRAEVGYYPVNGQRTELLLGVRRIKDNDLLTAAFANPAGAAAAKANQSWWSTDQLAQYLGVAQQPLNVDPVQTGYKVVPSSGLGSTEGSSLSSWWTRAAAAIRYADPSLLRATGGSRLADLRQPLQRVQQLAPWLTLDSQVYPAVVDGKVVWILDGYTTSPNYPESQVASLSAMTADSQNPRPTFGSDAGDDINYLRDAVKVVVDASSGAVTFYAWDDSDPILKAMESAFPGMIQPRTSIPAGVQAVLRYPTTLFAVQRAMLASYHETDPVGFLNDVSPWVVAPDTQELDEAAPALRGLVANSAGQLVPTMSSTYVDTTGAATQAYLSVNSDPTSRDFDQLQLTDLPVEPAVMSGELAAKEFAADPRVVALEKKLKTFSEGELITVPLAGGVLQAQTIYGSSVQPGQVKAFVATFGSAVGYGQTLAEAIADISRPHATKAPIGATAASVQLVREADALLARAALEKSDSAQYQADIARAKALLDRALKDPAWKAPSAAPSPSASTSPQPTAAPSTTAPR